MIAHQPIDGLTEDEYQRRVTVARQLRRTKWAAASPAEVVAIISDILNTPVDDRDWAQLDEEAPREFFDAADWIEFLHNTHYKPDWRIQLFADGRVFVLNTETMARVPESGHRNLVGLKVRVLPEYVRSAKDARRIVAEMIEAVELAITKAWLVMPSE